MMRGASKRGAIVGFELSLLLVSLFAFAYILSAAHPVIAQSTTSSPSVCCERTKQGALCVNTNQSECDPNARSTPTSCETTSYCKLGTCFDSSEGVCMENTPQSVCNQNGGTWDQREAADIPQCQLGCCIIGDQASFVSSVRCKKLSTHYGVENNFRTDINSEVACIAAAQSQDVGACVYEKDFERVCEFTTRADCGAGEEVEVNGSNFSLSGERKFYKDLLCSAEELNTVCARQTATMCKDGKVYWVDSCGNPENVYAANKDLSWNDGRVATPDEVCKANDGSNNACGNCDFLLGTRCSEYESLIGRPADSDHYCRQTKCVDRQGNNRINGESWCVYDGKAGDGLDPAGSRHFREVCVDGEVVVEPCADFRNEICIQGEIETDKGDFSASACRVNRWQECTQQTDEEECTDQDRRDCIWLPKITGLGEFTGDETNKGGFNNPTNNRRFSNPTGNVVAPITGHAALNEDTDREVYTDDEGVCVPNVPPGLNFWGEGTAGRICGQASAKCTVTYEKGLIGGSRVVSGGECLTEEWAMKANRLCGSLGDCGGYVNFNGEYTDDGFEWKVDGEKKEFSPNIQNKISGGFLGIFMSAVLGNWFLPFVGAQSGYNPTTGHIHLGPTTLPKGYVSGLPSSLNTPASNTLFNTFQYNVPGGATFSGGGSYFSGQFVGSGGTYGLSGTQVATLSADAKTLTIFDKAGGNVVAKHQSTAAFKSGAGVVGKGGGPGSTLSEFVGAGGGGFVDSLLSGVQYAAIAYFAGQLLGGLLGLDDDNTDALSISLASGAFVGKFLHVATQQGGLLNSAFGTISPLGSIAIGAAVSVVVFVVLYKDKSEKIVTFECKPWQPPRGGDECELCNDDDLPCSEYRCRSLGLSCELVNKGTEQEKCVNINPNDVTPPVISPDNDVLTKGHEYKDVRNSPPGPGFRIVNPKSSDQCLKAYTPLTFGIKTDEQAQCRIDFKHTDSFEEMVNFVGGSNLFSTEHRETFSLPGAKVLKNSSLVLENGKDLTFFIRCADKNGNENEAEYAVRFCMDDSPDTTAPQIAATSIQNNACVAENQANAEVEFYTNEPADCRWSTTDQSYDNMKNDMVCSNAPHQINSQQLFTCRSNLTGIARDGSDFYVRCKDQPGAANNDRNVNAESFKFTLKGSTGLKLKNLLPNETIFGGVSPAPVTLHVETLFGCSEGKARCFYATTDDEKDFIRFADTDTDDGHHNQRQDLVAGEYDYRVKCVDEGGNVARDNIRFKLEIDENAPVVARAYKEDDQLKIVTVRDSECAYSFNDCDFTFKEGTPMPFANSTVHVAEWKKDETYHIKCRDEFRNEDAQCSIIVKPSDIEL